MLSCTTCTDLLDTAWSLVAPGVVTQAHSHGRQGQARGAAPRRAPEHEAGHERVQQDVGAMKGDGVDAAPLRRVLPAPAQPCRARVHRSS